MHVYSWDILTGNDSPAFCISDRVVIRTSFSVVFSREEIQIIFPEQHCISHLLLIMLTRNLVRNTTTEEK